MDMKVKSSSMIPELEKLLHEEKINILKYIQTESDSIKTDKRPTWIIKELKKHFGSSIKPLIIEIIASHFCDGDSGIEMDVKPEWLDIEKFRRGQKFALDYMFSASYYTLLSLFIPYSFEGALSPIVITGKSSTPYTSFKRYVSTLTRFRNWYRSDPWTRGTEAYDDLRTVRRLHTMIRNKVTSMSEVEIEEKITIKDMCCPSIDLIRQDFHSECPEPELGHSLFHAMNYHPELKSKMKFLSQNDMVTTQLSFVGLCVTYPKDFGIHGATDEDLEDFCHTWRGLGYLLGIQDEFNYCRGSLEDVRARTKEFLEYWVKANFRNVSSQWEHMIRCMLEGFKYYFPGFSFDVCLLHLVGMMNLNMPRLYNSLSYYDWATLRLSGLYYNYGSKITPLRKFLNKQIHDSLDGAHKFDDAKLKQLQKKSEKTLKAYKVKMRAKKDVVQKLENDFLINPIARIMLILLTTFFIIYASFLSIRF